MHACFCRSNFLMHVNAFHAKYTYAPHRRNLLDAAFKKNVNMHFIYCILSIDIPLQLTRTSEWNNFPEFCLNLPRQHHGCRRRRGHWNGNVILTKLSSLAAPEIVILSTYIGQWRKFNQNYHLRFSKPGSGGIGSHDCEFMRMFIFYKCVHFRRDALQY